MSSHKKKSWKPLGKTDPQMPSHFNLLSPFWFWRLKTTFVAGKSTHKHTAAHPVPVTDLLCNLNVNVESVLCGSTVDIPDHGRTTNPKSVYVMRGNALPHLLSLLIFWFEKTIYVIVALI